MPYGKLLYSNELSNAILVCLRNWPGIDEKMRNFKYNLARETARNNFICFSNEKSIAMSVPFLSIHYCWLPSLFWFKYWKSLPFTGSWTDSSTRNFRCSTGNACVCTTWTIDFADVCVWESAPVCVCICETRHTCVFVRSYLLHAAVYAVAG